MKHIIRKAVLAPVPELEITAEEFLLLQRARQVLTSALSIEEKYEILVANYLALENQLLKIATTNVIRNILTYSEFFETRSALNVRMINLLNAARLYLDHLPQDIADCLPSNDAAPSLVKAKCSQEYDQHCEYRFMEALRNHAQHRGIPIHVVSQNAHWTSHDELGRMEYTVDMVAQRRYLEDDKKFKKNILEEVSVDVDLTAACRCYIESISSINQFVRDLIAEPVRVARLTIEGAYKRYSELYSESLIGLTAFALDGELENLSVPLLLDWDDVRLELQNRNSQLINLRKCYVTGKTRDDKCM